MRLRIFTVYDQKAKAYLPPFFLSEAGQAKRAFSDAVNNPEHQFGKHPEDYTLFLIGDFDDSTAKLLSFPANEVICNGLEVRQSERHSAQLDIPEIAAPTPQVARQA